MKLVLASILRYNGAAHIVQVPPLEPSSSWNGTAGSGFSSTPSDPTRTTAKPIVRLIDVERQTITNELTVSVMAAANNDGTLFNNMGIEYVDFHFEGTTQRVSQLSLRTFTRFDGSTYKLPCFSVTLKKPSGTEGLANLYVTAKPLDATMQSRVIGPFLFGLYNQEFDQSVTVNSAGGADYTSMSAAFAGVAGRIRPKITVTGAGDYSLAGGSQTTAQLWCTVEATAAVRFVEPAPATEATFTRMRPAMNNLHFKGSNITLDFVETLQFDPLGTTAYPWCDGIKIAQSRGREDLWRKVARNIIPALFRGGVYLTECLIEDVNDCGDKALLARGNVVQNTWADIFQGAFCVIGNKVIDHTSAFYYTNVDAMTVQYTGAATTATVDRTGGNFICKEDGVAVLTFALQTSSAAFTADTNYRVASLVAAIDALPDWSATLIDDSRAAAFISAPGTTNGANFTNLDVKTAKTLPTHFDIHSDWFQVPNSSFMENVLLAFNIAWNLDAQNFLIATNVEGNVKDFAVICNAFYNNLGTPDEALQTGLGDKSKHLVFAHNTLASQRVAVPPATGTADAYSLIANNVCRRLGVSGGGAAEPDVPIINNHVQEEFNLADTATGTSLLGDSTDLFVDAINGDFTPAGLLLTNLAAPVLPFDIAGQSFPANAPKGAKTV